MQDTLIILNPAARGERACHFFERVEALAGDALIQSTTRVGEAEGIARSAAREGYHKIVAAGGDGTIHEVVNGLAGTEAALGLLPMGTMNVFAAELGLPSGNLERCWDIIRAGWVRSVDLPRVNGRRFVQLAGVGLDAQAVKETSQALKRSFGPLSYIISAAQIASRPPPRLMIESDDAVATEASFVLVGNGRRYGGPFPFFKRAHIDDGLLDVVLFKRLGYFDIIHYLQEVIFSDSISGSEVEYLQTSRLRVTSEDEVPVEADGELIGSCPVEFEVQEHGLRVLTEQLAM